MTKNKLKVTLLVLVAISFGGCVQKNYIATKTGLELQSIQKKSFDTKYKIAFASTVSVFQDKGYIIETADASTGFVTASSHKTSGQAFMAQTIDFVKATAFIELMPNKKISIRLNFVSHQETSSGYGMKGGNSVPIEEPSFYQGIFEQIQKAIFIRQNV